MTVLNQSQACKTRKGALVLREFISLLKELPESWRHACAACLFPIYIVHGRVPAVSCQNGLTCFALERLTSISLTRSYRIPSLVPIKQTKSVSLYPCIALDWRKPTCPRRLGSYTSRRATLPKMKKKPSSVTILGASHIGSSLTKPFHYQLSECILLLRSLRKCAYIMSEYVVWNVWFVDGRVLVRLEVDQGILGERFMDRRP